MSYYDNCDYKGNKDNPIERTERGKKIWWENNSNRYIEVPSYKMSLIYDAYNDYKISENWEENY